MLVHPGDLCRLDGVGPKIQLSSTVFLKDCGKTGWGSSKGGTLQTLKKKSAVNVLLVLTAFSTHSFFPYFMFPLHST